MIPEYMQPKADIMAPRSMRKPIVKDRGLSEMDALFNMINDNSADSFRVKKVDKPISKKNVDLKDPIKVKEEAQIVFDLFTMVNDDFVKKAKSNTKDSSSDSESYDSEEGSESESESDEV